MEKKDASPTQSDTFLYLLVIPPILFAYFKIAPLFHRYWQMHPILCLIGVTFLVVGTILVLLTHLWNHLANQKYALAITAPDKTSVFLGRDESDKRVYLKETFRRSHTQIIGTTNAGKTESVILPWIIKDLENGSGALIIDGKSDVDFLDKLYAYVVKTNRQKDFRFFSLVQIDKSHPFNPFRGGTAQEIAERIFSSFPIEHPHFKPIQSKMFLALVTLVTELGFVPSFSIIHRLLTDSLYLTALLEYSKNEDIKRLLEAFLKKSNREKSDEISGLEANLSPFAFGTHAELFNVKDNAIDFDEALRQNQICYFQLPTMLYPFLGEATGKLVLQSFQSAVAKRQVGLTKKARFFSCYLDDFQDYIYRGFGALLNKSRSANIGVVFSHQALGDLDKVGNDFRNVVLTNTNIKVIMRSNDPGTCEHFAKSFGTRKSEKKTERRTRSAFGEARTGEGSVRDVEEYIYHPNEIKQLGIGEAIVSIPHPRGVKTTKLTFQMKPGLPPVTLPSIQKTKIDTEDLLLSRKESKEINRL